MNSRKNIFLILVFLLCSNSIVFSQNNDIEIEDEKSIVMGEIPYLPHAITTNGKQGYTYVFNAPGFFGYFGISSLYYTNSFGSSFFGGIDMGLNYLMSGMNLVIKDYTSTKLYINATFGLANANAVSKLGSFGISYIIKNKSVIYELSVDAYYHEGAIDNFVFPADAPYLRGIMANIHFKTEISENFSINYGIGLSFIQYRYLERNNLGDSRNDYNYYATKYSEHEDIKSGFGRNPAWDSKLIIPFGISLSYHF